MSRRFRPHGLATLGDRCALNQSQTQVSGAVIQFALTSIARIARTLNNPADSNTKATRPRETTDAAMRIAASAVKAAKGDVYAGILHLRPRLPVGTRFYVEPLAPLPPGWPPRPPFLPKPPLPSASISTATLFPGWLVPYGRLTDRWNLLGANGSFRIERMARIEGNCRLGHPRTATFNSHAVGLCCPLVPGDPGRFTSAVHSRIEGNRAGETASFDTRTGDGGNSGGHCRRRPLPPPTATTAVDQPCARAVPCAVARRHLRRPSTRIRSQATRIALTTTNWDPNIYLDLPGIGGGGGGSSVGGGRSCPVGPAAAVGPAGAKQLSRGTHPLEGVQPCWSTSAWP